MKPEFGFVGIAVGLVAGWPTGLGLEIAWGKPKMLIMFGAVLLCVLLGAAVDTVRFLWLLRRYRDAQKL